MATEQATFKGCYLLAQIKVTVKEPNYSMKPQNFYKIGSSWKVATIC